jgi:hypothetical protein
MERGSKEEKHRTDQSISFYRSELGDTSNTKKRPHRRLKTVDIRVVLD